MRFAASIFLIAIACIALPARAHPMLTHEMRVVVCRDHLTLEAKISLEEVDIANSFADDTKPAPDVKAMRDAIAAHAAYVLGHFHVCADGAQLAGRVLSASPSTEPVTWDNFEDIESAATYTIEYPLAHAPKNLRIAQDLLKEYGRMGQPWVVSLVTEYRLAHESQWNDAFLTRDQPLTISCTWPANATEQPPSTISHTNLWHTARAYAYDGLMHILTGYDHLLFVAALVIGATQLWDLVKVVSAFAVAHTLTLTLSVLHLVHVPSTVVEPMIAASIVCVALQNVFFPKQSRGPTRLAIAFGFGLFHGLGFAGGLADAMSHLPISDLATALIAFTLGVEAAHQMLIIPLYLLLKQFRSHPHEFPALRLPLHLRLASLAISVVGMAYFVAALRAPI
jgi:hydrogenase/urease accessory protein HupE